MGRGRKVEGVMNELPEPTETQCIVKVTGKPGGNLVQVVDPADKTFLCRIPAKYRNVIWIKIGGYLIVEKENFVDGEGDADAPKCQAALAHHLYRDQIRHLQSRKLWPEGFEEIDPAAGGGGDAYGVGELRANTNHDFRDLPPSSDDGSEAGEEGDEKELAVDAMGNTIARGEPAAESDDVR